MKRKLNKCDEYSHCEVTATTGSLSCTSQSLCFPQGPAQESCFQVAFCEQTAREMTELVNYWQAVQSAQKERSPVPHAPMRNSLYLWSDDDEEEEEHASIMDESILYRQLFAEDAEEDDNNDIKHEEEDYYKGPIVLERTILSETSEIDYGKILSPGASKIHHTQTIQYNLASIPSVSTPDSRDDNFSLPSEIHIRRDTETTYDPESPNWSDHKANRKILQNMRIVSQEQSKQVDIVMKGTATWEQQAHDTLMNSPLFQRYNRRSCLTKQWQGVLATIDMALDHPTSPIVSSPFKCLQDDFELWLRYEWHRFEDKLQLGLLEWIPLEFLSIYYHLWTRPSARTRWLLLLIIGSIGTIFFYCIPLGSTTSPNKLVHFPEQHSYATTFTDSHSFLVQEWLL